MRRWYYSGICRCGHSWDDHHLCCVMNADYAKLCKEWDQPPYVPCECEFYGCNEDGGKGPDGEDHCYGYKDKDAPSD